MPVGDQILREQERGREEGRVARNSRWIYSLDRFGATSSSRLFSKIDLPRHTTHPRGLVPSLVVAQKFIFAGLMQVCLTSCSPHTRYSLCITEDEHAPPAPGLCPPSDKPPANLSVAQAQGRPPAPTACQPPTHRWVPHPEAAMPTCVSIAHTPSSPPAARHDNAGDGSRVTSATQPSPQTPSTVRPRRVASMAYSTWNILPCATGGT